MSHSPYECKTWTLLADCEEKLQVFDTKARGHVFASPTWSTRPTTWCGAQDQRPCGHTRTTSNNSADTETRKFRACQASRQHFQNHPSGHAPLGGARLRGRHRKCWMDNMKEWTSLPMPELLTMAFRRKDWNRISAE